MLPDRSRMKPSWITSALAGAGVRVPMAIAHAVEAASAKCRMLCITVLSFLVYRSERSVCRTNRTSSGRARPDRQLRQSSGIPARHLSRPSTGCLNGWSYPVRSATVSSPWTCVDTGDARDLRNTRGSPLVSCRLPDLLPQGHELLRCGRVDADRRVELRLGEPRLHRDAEALDDLGRIRPDHVRADDALARTVDDELDDRPLGAA